MKNQKSFSIYGLLCGLLCILRAVGSISALVSYFNFLNLVGAICYVYTAVLLFMGKRNVASIVGFGVLALVDVVSIIGSASNITILIMNVMNFVCYLSLVILFLSSMTTPNPLAKKLWFLPGLFCIGQNITYIVFLLPLGMGAAIGSMLVSFIPSIALFCVAGLWAVDAPKAASATDNQAYAQNSLSADAPTVTTTTAATTKTADYGEGFISMGFHVLLLVLTGGIWTYIWIYRTTKYLNCVEDEEYRNPTSKLLLCIFIPFYYIYWIYKSAQRIDKLAASKGISSDISTLCLILAFFVGIVPPILMQDKINACCQQKSAAAPVAAKTPVTTVNIISNTTTVSDGDAVEELKRYKELLDTGILTPEEYEAKKKQLLNL